MGLIYVNPEGPNGNPDPLAAAGDIRETFRRMAMNDEETVALIAGGHTFGKTHGAADRNEYVGPEPEGAPLEEQGLGWRNSFGTGKGADTITSGIEVTWTPTPTQWSNNFLENLFGYEWELTKSPAGANQWEPKDGAGAGTVPDAHDPAKRHAADDADDRPGAARSTPSTSRSRGASYEHPDELADAFARAWFKLTHRDMGPVARYLGPRGPERGADLAGPGPGGRSRAGRRRRDRRAEGARSSPRGCRSRSSSRRPGRRPRRSAAATSAAAPTGRASAWSRRRAGTVNDPAELATVLDALEGIQEAFNAAQPDGKQVSLADLIVLGGRRGGRAGGQGRRPRRRGPVHARAAPTPRRSRPTSSPSPCSSRRPTASATTSGQAAPAAGRVPAGRPGEPADPERARDDRARRRPARAGRELPAAPGWASSPTGPGR